LANHPSAIKRHRQSQKRTIRNRFVRATVRTATKKVEKASEAGTAEGIDDLLRDAISKLNKAASKGVIRKQTASRKIGRLTKRAQALGS
jgi:small subunit ribosomal protein S20